jgi:hypothetical protein
MASEPRRRIGAARPAPRAALGWPLATPDPTGEPVRHSVRSCLGLALFALLACASDDAIPVSTNYDPLVRFPAEATLVWDEVANVLPDDPAIDRAGTDALLRSVASEAFEAKGYRVVASEPADFRLSYQYTVHTYIGTNESRALGSVSLLMSDNQTGRRVWMGFGRAEIHVGLTPEERRARLADAIARMLEDFPPRQRPEA